MTALFTERAAAVAGEPLHVVISARTAVSADGYPELRAGQATVLRRDGCLVTASGRPVAAVWSAYVPWLLPPGAARLLARTSVPLGVVLGAFGAERTELEAEPGCTRGLLLANGVPVAVAGEQAL